MMTSYPHDINLLSLVTEDYQIPGKVIVDTRNLTQNLIG